MASENMLEFWSLFGVYTTVDLLNLMLHVIGAYLLYLLHLKNKDNTQTLYILNLACTEMISCLMNILYKISYALYISFPILFFNVFSNRRPINAIFISISLSTSMDTWDNKEIDYCHMVCMLFI